MPADEKQSASAPANESEAQRQSRALSDAMADAQERKATDEHKGGRYRLSADGPLMDADGNEIKEK